jgi:membrane protein implicated in regulation of membrane protease activity
MTEIEIVFWHWWVLAVFMLVVELLSPGFFFLWMAISGFVTGSIVLLMPSISLDVQVLIFSVLSIASILIWKVYVKKHPTVTDNPLLNKRSAQYIGRVFTLIEPIENGHGKIKVDDSIWKVRGEECDVGTKVKVVGADGVLLDVEIIR